MGSSTGSHREARGLHQPAYTGALPRRVCRHAQDGVRGGAGLRLLADSAGPAPLPSGAHTAAPLQPGPRKDHYHSCSDSGTRLMTILRSSIWGTTVHSGGGGCRRGDGGCRRGDGGCRREDGGCRREDGGCRRGDGGCRQEDGGCRQEDGGCRRGDGGCRQEDGGCRQEDGGCRRGDGGCRRGDGGCRQEDGGCRQEDGGCRRGDGGCRQEDGGCRQEDGGCRRGDGGCRQEDGGCRQEDGGCRRGDGGCRQEDGGCRQEDGGCRREDGGCRQEDGGCRRGDGGCRVHVSVTNRFVPSLAKSLAGYWKRSSKDSALASWIRTAAAANRELLPLPLSYNVGWIVYPCSERLPGSFFRAAEIGVGTPPFRRVKEVLAGRVKSAYLAELFYPVLMFQEELNRQCSSWEDASMAGDPHPPCSRLAAAQHPEPLPLHARRGFRRRLPAPCAAPPRFRFRFPGEVGGGAAGTGVRPEVPERLRGAGVRPEVPERLRGAGVRPEVPGRLRGAGVRPEVPERLRGAGVRPEVPERLRGAGVRPEVPGRLRGAGVRPEVPGRLRGAGVRPEVPERLRGAGVRPEVPERLRGAGVRPEVPERLRGAGVRPEVPGRLRGAGVRPEVPERLRGAGVRPEVPERLRGAGVRPEVPGRLRGAGVRPEVPGRLRGAGVRPEVPGRLRRASSGTGRAERSCLSQAPSRRLDPRGSLPPWVPSGMACPRLSGRVSAPLSAPVSAALLALLCGAWALSVAPESAEFPWTAVRLPTDVVPLHYRLLIHPNLTTLTFAGTADIQVLTTRQTGAVILHGKRLNISEATLAEDAVGEAAAGPALRVLQEPSRELVALLAPRPLLPGRRYTIRIRYRARLSQSFHGFYNSSYRTRQGELRVLAVTQFEPTAARMAFPCFDEPAFKATFSIRIRRDPEHLALSNMPIVKSVTLSPWLVEDHFDTTVRMSTYLVAFIVSDFKSISKMSSHGVKVSVYSVPEKISQAEYALEAAVKLLDFYEDYFGIPYPLPKQDLAAVPDFQSGAMENWGLTTYRESALLYDPEKSSSSSKLWITMVIAHELAHQWFGNLVTMEWWNDLWLNEGFAKFMEFVSVSVTHPELRVEDYFLRRCFDAMAVDALNSSHPVSTPVEDPAAILEMFDEVSYVKGSCILNMLRDYLTADVFKAGLVQYLQKHSYQNTRNEHLWDSLANVCPTGRAEKNELQGFCRRGQQPSSSAHWTQGETLDVKAMMDTWTLQKGYPLVTVTVRGKNVHLQQEHYMKGGKPSTSTGSLWHIPLTYITSKSDTVQRFLMTTRADVLLLPEEVEWIKFNVDMKGYYLVHYAGGMWDPLISLLRDRHTLLSSSDRANLINNVFQMVSIKQLPISKALDLTLYLQQETEILPVLQGLHELIPIYRLMEARGEDGTTQQLQEHLVRLFRELIDHQSWSDEGSVSQRLLRSSLLLFACLHRYQPCLDKASRHFTQWQQSNGTLSLPADVKSAVYAVGAQTAEGWEFLLSRYQLPAFSTEREDMEIALSLSRSQERLQWLMDQGLHGDIIRTQDLPSLLVFIARNPSGHDLAWAFLKANWDQITAKFELGSSSVAQMVTGVTRRYSTRAQLAQVEEFFSSLEEKGSQLRCVQQAMETIQDNIQWMDSNLEQLRRWLHNHHHKGPGGQE
ncbi:endoplasmic reticulum aminopeptidase 1 [Dryobates pubescens]|uniref:endoplasmic reticulum aminopeptidase 1 n=1 Tax=Dryobates pubescens TaxID=118200 RepID=UPI0023BA2B6B|nr:endoplasmic reticulum aminopeptidase 1 [Dryobates pubescens]